MARVCYGEFDYPEGCPEDRLADRTGRTAYLQNEFLKAIHKHAPEVWEDLYRLRELALPLNVAWHCEWGATTENEAGLARVTCRR